MRSSVAPHVIVAKEAETLLYDGCLDFALGLNSGIAPQSLPKNQAAFAFNATFRGDFITDRPPYRKVQLDATASPLLQSAIGQGVYQGATNYLALDGSESIICSIAGRLFKITPSTSPTGTALVEEITIPGDPNPPAVSQAFLWQSERWLILEDGISKALFYDGVSSRRSVPAATLVGTTNAPFTTPLIGGTVNITLAAPYTGPVNQTLNLVGFDASGNVNRTDKYVVTLVNGNPLVNTVVLKNLSAVAGTTILALDDLVIRPALAGYVTTLGTFTQSGTTLSGSITLTAALPNYVAVGGVLNVGTSGNWTITSISTNRLTAHIKQVTTVQPAVNDLVTISGVTQANQVVGTLNMNFTAPAIGTNVTANISSPYVAGNGKIIWIGNTQWQVISSASTVAPSNTITVENLNGTAAATVATGAQLITIPELPTGRMGTYGMGRNWLSLIDGRSFIGGDIVGGEAGSPAYDFTDAVLKVSENTLLAGGGTFKVPSNSGQITAMSFTATLDVSLGQGPLQVFTNKNVFSCNAPVDRTTWQNLTSPILTEALKGSGAAGAYAIINSNADILFRSPDAQIRSLILSRLDFNRWGNTPISFEMLRVTDVEPQDFMPFCSGIEFDNRLLVTSNPVQGPSGVYWQGLIALNFDPISSLQDKVQSAYDGLWNGLNIFQVVRFTSVERAFACCIVPATNTFEIYELLPDGDEHFDNGVTPIIWGFESPMMFHQIKGKSVFDQVKLEDGELYVSDIIGRVDFKVQYRPDFDSCWHDWHSWFVCSAQSGTDPRPQYRKRMGFGQPQFDGACNINTDQPPQYGTMFQVRVLIQGHCVVNGFRTSASLQPIPVFSEPICNTNE